MLRDTIKTNSHVQTSIQQTGLICFLCRLSPGSTPDQKEKKWNLAQLNKHLKSDVHNPEKGLRRAANDVVAAGGKPSCPCCQKEYQTAGALIKHVKKMHKHALTGKAPASQSSSKKSQAVAADEEEEDDADEPGIDSAAGPSHPPKRVRYSRRVYEDDFEEEAATDDSAVEGDVAMEDAEGSEEE